MDHLVRGRVRGRVRLIDPQGGAMDHLVRVRVRGRVRLIDP